MSACHRRSTYQHGCSFRESIPPRRIDRVVPVAEYGTSSKCSRVLPVQLEYLVAETKIDAALAHRASAALRTARKVGAIAVALWQPHSSSAPRALDRNCQLASALPTRFHTDKPRSKLYAVLLAFHAVVCRGARVAERGGAVRRRAAGDCRGARRGLPAAAKT